MNALDRQRLLDAARDVLAAALPQAWVIYVYGSFARGDEWPDSDLDLAVLLAPQAAIADKLALMAEVSRRIGREVDIVSLREADLDLVYEVLKDGQPLLVRRKAESLGWEAERMTDYAQFNSRRSDIVELYLRGSLRTP